MADPAARSPDFPFGLQCDAFSIAPDPRFLYLSPLHQAALDTLRHGLQRGEGLVLLTGEIGAGKTTVWRAFLQQRPAQLEVAYIGNPQLAPAALLRRICAELQMDPAASASPDADLIDLLHGHLLLAHAQGRRCLIVLDEAQSLSFAVLEQLRLLTNLVTDERKLVQIWLIGQPELRAMLAMPEMAPLSQRVVARYHLSELNPADTADYIAHRLSVAGYQGPALFDEDTVLAVHDCCQGTPRRINVLCERALALAAEAGQNEVRPLQVAQAARLVFDDPARRPTLPARPDGRVLARQWAIRGLAAGVVLAALAVGWQVIGGRTGPARQPVPALPASVPSPVSTPEPVSGARPVTASDLAALFADPPLNEPQAWQALAASWGVTLTSETPCVEAAARHLACYTTSRGLAVIRLLNRPGWLTLREAQGGRIARLELVGLDPLQARLRTRQGRTMDLPLADLARLWQGDFATWWRTPEAYEPNTAPDTLGPLADAVARALAALDGGPPVAGPVAQAWRERLATFQRQQGLQADGAIGPMTLMRLNQARGVPEPTLSSH